LQVVCTRLCQCQRHVEFSVRKQPGVGGDLAAREPQLQTAIEIDPQLSVLAVTHRISLSAWHECAKDPCFSGLWRKSHAKPAGLIWEIRDKLIIRGVRDSFTIRLTAVVNKLAARAAGACGHFRPFFMPQKTPNN
jgi:hypothetical protein